MTTTPAVVVKSIDPQVPPLPEKIVMIARLGCDWCAYTPDPNDIPDMIARATMHGEPVRIIRLHADAPVCTDAMVAAHIRSVDGHSTKLMTDSEIVCTFNHTSLSFRAGFAAALAAMGVGNG